MILDIFRVIGLVMLGSVVFVGFWWLADSVRDVWEDRHQ